MAERKIVVPEGMMKAAQCAGFRGWTTAEQAITLGLEAALRWLSENPIVPSVEQCDAIRDVLGPREDLMQWQVKEVAFEWQRRMFLASEPEIPEERFDSDKWADVMLGVMLERLAPIAKGIALESWEAYRRGQKSKETL